MTVIMSEPVYSYCIPLMRVGGSVELVDVTLPEKAMESPEFTVVGMIDKDVDVL
jgi:hypothetical protein